MVTRTEQPQPPNANSKRKRRSAARGIVFMGLAVAAALGAALLLTRYMDRRVAAARVPTAKVVVANRDIPIATPLNAQWLTAVDWPAASRPEGTAADASAVVGRATLAAIAKGEPILASKLAAAGARGGLATLVPAGMRAAAVRVDDVVGVAGFVHPGDFVDVIVTMKPQESAPFVSKIVLQQVKVLAVGKEIEYRGAGGKEAEKGTPVTVATLLVSVEESERLALSATKGQILLTLRGNGDEELAETRGIVPTALLAAAIPEPPRPPPPAPEKPRRRHEPRRHPEPPAVAAQPPPKDNKVVEILRGDVFEKRDFDAQEKRR